MVTARETPARPGVGLSVTATAEYLACSRDTVYRLIRDGDLEAVRIGSRPIVLWSSIDAYLERVRIPIAR